MVEAAAKAKEKNENPDSLQLFGEQLVKSSGKMVLMEKLLRKLFDGGHKVLVFSQMVRMLDLLEELLRIKKYRYERLDGSTSSSSRLSAVDRFNRKSCQRFVMLLSTRAGGLGLNLVSLFFRLKCMVVRWSLTNQLHVCFPCRLPQISL